MLLTALISLLVLLPAPAWASPRDRILLVVSGHGASGEKSRPGFEMDELAQAWHIFRDNGLEVDIASPAGGEVVADEFEADKPYNQRFLADRAAIAKLKGTLPVAGLLKQRYSAIFVIGGKGAMLDLPVNAELKQLIADTWEAGGVIGAVCHGPAVLMNIRLSDGAGLIAGRRVTGFSNQEEALFGQRWASSFPVLLEDGMRGAGGRFSEAPMMLAHVVTDERIVTGQNPYSTAAAAEAVVRATGRTPVTRQPWADERSIALISEVLAGRVEDARQALKAYKPGYDIPLIAAWGVYRAKMAKDDPVTLQSAIAVMELALPHHPGLRLREAIAAARQRISAFAASPASL
jgi:putative intracellular protease/amidase